MIIYYSGTGNSRLIAEIMANHLQDEIIDATLYIRNNETLCVRSSKPLVFVAPTYAWQLPRIFVDFIRSMKVEGNRHAYFMMTCGDSIGNASFYTRAMCQDIGLIYKGTAEVVMPENYVAMFPVPDEKESDEIIQRALHHLQEFVECIQKDKDFVEKKAGFIAKKQSGIVNIVFYKFFVKDHQFYATDQCIGCGICAKKCPLNNIKIIDGKPKWNHNCTHCMACICYCPKEAIEYGKKAKGKRRYRCVYEVEK